MKRFPLLVVLFAAMQVCLPLRVLAGDGKPVTIRSIAHEKDAEGNETITFKLAAPVTAKIFTLDSDKPRLVIDFPLCIYWGKTAIPLADGDLASAIRIGLHRNPAMWTRVAVDLSRRIPVRYASEYSEQDKTLSITLMAKAGQPPEKPPRQAQSPIPIMKPGQNKVPVTASAARNDTPPGQATGKQTVKKAAEKPAQTGPAAPVLATLLDISVDVSSQGGEMVLFRLNGYYPPAVSAMEKKLPRIICDFNAVRLGPEVLQDLAVKGKYLRRIHAAEHGEPGKIRILVDLAPGHDYDLQQVFSKSDNLFFLIVTESPPAPDADRQGDAERIPD
jgi:hypothetical protein